MPQLYYNRRRREYSRRHPTLELAVSVVVAVVVIGMLLLFLLGYHDLPFRLSSGY